MAAYSTDQFMGQPSGIHLVNIADDLSEQKGDVIKSLSGPKGRITRVAWTDLNRTLVTAGEDGFVRRWDVEVSMEHLSPSALTSSTTKYLQYFRCTYAFLPCADWQDHSREQNT